MKTVSKQTVLKGALLAVLAANISWQTQSTFTTDLASELATASAAKLPPPPPAVTIRTAPTAANAAKAGNSGPKPEAPARAQVATEQVKRDEVLLKLEACGKEAVVTFFEEKQDDGKPSVRGLVKINGRDIGATDKGVTLANFKKSEAKQDAFMKLFADEAEKSCATDIAVDKTKEIEEGQPSDDSAERAKRRADRIARGLRNCTGDAQGRALKSEDKIECHLDRISTDETQDIDDMDDRASRRKRSTAKSQFSDSVDYMVGEVSALLASDEAEDRRDGKMLKKDLEDALKDARDNGVVSRSEVSIAQARVKALETGMNLDARTDFYARQANQIDQQIYQIRQQLPQAQMQSPMYAQMMQQQLQSLDQQKRALATNSMAQDSMYTAYAGLRNQGIVHAEEYSTFSQSYEDLMRSLSGNQSPTQVGGAPGQPLPGTSVMPSSEATTFRNNPNGNNLNVRSGGFATPAFPRI